MITTRYKTFFNDLFEPFARTLMRFSLTPNQITLSGLALGFVSCFILIWTKNIYLFCVLILASAIFDAADGLVARLSGQVTKFGSYLDAVCDRLFEGMVAVSVAWFSGYWFLIFLLFIGAVLTSYAKARAAMEVPVSNSEWPDLMERTERGVLFIAGLLISELTRVRIFGKDLFYWILIFLIATVYTTVIQRIFRAKHLIESRA